MTLRTRANWNILLDGCEERPSLAQAIRAAHLPAGGPDPVPVCCTTVTTGPADCSADVEGGMGRWKGERVGCNRWRHNVLIARRIGSLQGGSNGVVRATEIKGHAVGASPLFLPFDADNFIEMLPEGTGR